MVTCVFFNKQSDFSMWRLNSVEQEQYIVLSQSFCVDSGALANHTHLATSMIEPSPIMTTNTIKAGLINLFNKNMQKASDHESLIGEF